MIEPGWIAVAYMVFAVVTYATKQWMIVNTQDVAQQNKIEIVALGVKIAVAIGCVGLVVLNRAAGGM